MRAWATRVLWGAGLAAGLGLGCGSSTPEPTGGAGGSSSSSGHAGSGHAGSTGEAGGDAGVTGCTPGATSVCDYSGDPSTLGKGACKAGTHVCAADGMTYGDCEGEVLPSMEVCGNGLDDDCDGKIDNGCVCAPGSSELCYSGPHDTMFVGACVPGTHTCKDDGYGYGPCVGEVVPKEEVCDANNVDEDCDGQINEDGANCACVPGAVTPCYDGAAGTENVGTCKPGTHVCKPDGLGYGPCMGQVTPALESCGGVDIDCDGTPAPFCPGQHISSARFGAQNADQGNSIAVDAIGNVLITGFFQKQVDFGGGPLASAGITDIVLAKYDYTGKHLWSKRFGANVDDIGRGVAVDAMGNVVLVGYSKGAVDFGGGPLASAGDYDVVVAKFDPQGQHLWSRRFGSTGDDGATAVAVDATGNVVVTGYHQATVDFGGGPLATTGSYDIFVLKLDPAGQHLWSKQFGGTSPDLGFSIATDAAGDVVITGGFQGTADFGGGPLTSGGDEDVFLVKLDPAGQHLWSKRFGGIDQDRGQGVAVDANGNIVVTTRFNGPLDFGGGPLVSAGGFDVGVAKFDPQGQHLWSQRFGGSSDDSGTGVTVTKSGDVVLVGLFVGATDFGGGPLTGAGGFDVFVAKLDPSGQHLWSKGFGSSGFDVGQAVAADAAGSVLVTGGHSGTVSFGGGTLTSAGGLDIFVTRLAP